MKYANMHLHTVHSDGVLTPYELCAKAKELGFGALSITDHHTVSGWKSFEAAAKQVGIDYILGLEGNGKADGHNFHIVAYHFDPTAPAMAEYLKNEEDSAMALTEARFKACIAEGAFEGITWQDVLDNSPERCWICNEQVFATLVKLTDWEQKDYWRFVRSFNTKKVEYKKTNRAYSAKEFIKIIRDAGGIASLAHPHNQTQCLPELFSYGLNCVEYDHPDINEFDSKEAYKFAKEHNMYVSGGTDHTGKLSNYPHLRGNPSSLGSSFLTPLDADVRNGITKEEFLDLKNRTKE